MSKTSHAGRRQTEPEEQQVQRNMCTTASHIIWINKQTCYDVSVLFVSCRWTQQLTWPSTFACLTQSARPRRNLLFPLSSAKRSQTFFQWPHLIYVDFLSFFLKLFLTNNLKIQFSFNLAGKPLCCNRAQVPVEFCMNPMPTMTTTRRTLMMILMFRFKAGKSAEDPRFICFFCHWRTEKLSML